MGKEELKDRITLVVQGMLFGFVLAIIFAKHTAFMVAISITLLILYGYLILTKKDVMIDDQ